MAVVIKRLFCLDLPTSGLVIGYLGVFGGIWEIIEILLGLIYFEDYFQAKYSAEVLSIKDTKTIHYAILLLMLAGCLLDLLSSVLLIQGTNKKLHKLILPWLIIKGIALAIIIPVTSICIFVGFYLFFTGNGTLLLANSILLLLAAGLYSYLFMVIYSLYYFIRDEVQKPHQTDSEAVYGHPNIYYSKT